MIVKSIWTNNCLVILLTMCLTHNSMQWNSHKTLQIVRFVIIYRYLETFLSMSRGASLLLFLFNAKTICSNQISTVKYISCSEYDRRDFGSNQSNVRIGAKLLVSIVFNIQFFKRVSFLLNHISRYERKRLCSFDFGNFVNLRIYSLSEMESYEYQLCHRLTVFV